MDRRNFLQGITLSATGGLGAIATGEAREQKSVTFKVTGFTCITCATGLEVILGREKGVSSVKASYPDATAVVTFDPKSIGEKSIQAVIAELGFRAEKLA
jgi:copper chaperone CopZ